MSKSDVVKIFTSFHDSVENQLNHVISVVQTGTGVELLGQFQSYLVSNSIHHIYTWPHTSQQNAIAQACVVINHVPANEQVADMFSKPLIMKTFVPKRRKLEVASLSEILSERLLISSNDPPPLKSLFIPLSG